MAADPSTPTNGKTDAVPSRPPERLPKGRRSGNGAPSQPHEYTSLHDLLEFPCTCQVCTYLRQPREPGGRRPQPHEYTSLHDLLEFPCTCPLCTYLRQPREPGGRRPQPGPELGGGGIVTRLALALLLPLPDPPRRFRSKRLTVRRFLRGPRAPADASLEFLGRNVVPAISQAFERLVKAIQAVEEEEEDVPPRRRLPFLTC